MKSLYAALTVLLFITVDSIAAPWDTGYIVWEQPDHTTFTARSGR